MFSISFRESYLCANCNTPLDVQKMDELHNGEIKIYLVPCSKCAAQNVGKAPGCTCNAYQLENFGCKCGAVANASR